MGLLGSGHWVHDFGGETDDDLARDIFLGSAANEVRVKPMKLADYRIIAFATHGPGSRACGQHAVQLRTSDLLGVVVGRRGRRRGAMTVDPAAERS